MEQYQKTERTTASRYQNQRINYDTAVVNPILDEALFCNISTVHHGKPFAIPTAFVRDGNTIYIHGSIGSHFLRALTKGTEVCISVMLADDLVIAKSAFDHSVNYRSVIAFSQAEPIDDFELRKDFFKKLTEKIVPGSWDYLRPMQDKEVEKTMLVAFTITEASAKVRTGMPSYPETENDLPIWSGVVPLAKGKLTPIADEYSKDIPLPKHLQ